MNVRYCVIAIAFALASATSCGTGSHTGPLTTDETPLPVPLDQLASPAAMLSHLPVRSASSPYDEADVQKEASAYDVLLSSGNISPDGSALDLLPQGGATPSGIEQLAYSVYGFHLEGYNRNAQVRLDWAVPPADLAGSFVGIANFAANHWDWYAGTADGVLDLASLDPYFSANADLLVVVMLLGSADAKLNSVRIGGLAPQAKLYVDKRYGQPAHSFKMDAGGTTDPAGGPLTYEFDPEGDGTFLPPQADPKYDGAVLANEGSYNASVRVTNSINASVMAQVPVYVVGDWQHTWGMDGGDSYEDFIVTAAGDVFATGFANSPDHDLLLSRWTIAGQHVWSRTIDGGGFDTGSAIGRDNDGNLYIGGAQEVGSIHEMLLQKWTPDGKLLWSRRWGVTGICAGVVVSGQSVFIYGQCLRSGDFDLVLLRFDLDGNLVWQRYRDAGAEDYAVQLRGKYGITGLTGLICMSDCKINSDFNIVKTEFDLSGAVTSCKQLGTSATAKRDGHLIYQPGIAPDSTYYYLAGSIETANGMRTFVSQTDGTGANVWAESIETEAEIHGLAFNTEGNLVLSGTTKEFPSAGFMLACNPNDGSIDGQRAMYCGSLGREFNANQNAAGMLYCGQAESADSGPFTALPDTAPLMLQFQACSASGGDPGYFSDDTVSGIVTNVTAQGVLDSGAGAEDAELWHYTKW